MKKIITLLCVLVVISMLFGGCNSLIDANSTGGASKLGNTNDISDVSSIEVVNSSTAEMADEEENNNRPESLAEKIEREIEAEYEKDSELPEYGTTLGMVELADKYAARWKQVSDEYYNKIIECEGYDGLETSVSAMKANFEDYSTKQIDDYIKTLRSVYGNATIVGPCAAVFEMNLQKEWALQIINICEQLNIK